MMDFQVHLFPYEVFEATSNLRIPDTAWMYYVARDLTKRQRRLIDNQGQDIDAFARLAYTFRTFTRDYLGKRKRKGPTLLDIIVILH